MLLTHLFLVQKKSPEDSSEAVLTSLLEINALTVSKIYLPAWIPSQVCSLFKMFYLLLTVISFSEKLQVKQRSDSKNTFWHLILKRIFIARLFDNLKYVNVERVFSVTLHFLHFEFMFFFPKSFWFSFLREATENF